MKEKDFHSITIKELTTKALVARRTFYKHFSNKDDVLDYKVNQINQLYIKELMSAGVRNTYEFGVFFFSFFKNLADLIILFNDYNLFILKAYNTFKYDMITNKEFLDKLKIPDSMYNIAYRYGGIFFMLTEWIESGMKESVEEMAKYFEMEIPKLT